MQLTFKPLSEKHIIPMEVFGMDRDVPCCLNKSTKWCQKTLYFYDKNQKEVIAQGIHSYLYQLFGPSVNYQVVSGFYELPPRLENINRSDVILKYLKEEKHELEAYFNATQNQEYVHIKGDLISKVISNSVVYGTKQLKINCCGNYGDEVLFRFRGESLFLKETMFRNSTIITFLNEWKSNRGFTSIKYLSIVCCDQKYLDTAVIEKNVKIKQLSQSEKMLVLTWKERTMVCMSRDDLSVDRSIMSRSYLIRDFDGEGASIEIHPTHFVFAVWNATENPHATEHLKTSG
ncbi:hypothetical protein GCK72_020071 [Caenorhabditis remanei]|uniref:F-box associated domain-containing protein n=1 Tax=Caenorhabditis remanei TaxID=31234 RepID=A0A6A5GFI4_CAERE|nr:hypothetical protein GCK72_020071 [Caenorhabditis remanei]KAF1753514.1 hypothetical protein GCK72_020071 [Caenorhabditis remanei]